MTEYQIEIFPTLATIAEGDRLRLTLSTADTPHLTPLPEQLPSSPAASTRSSARRPPRRR